MNKYIATAVLSSCLFMASAGASYAVTEDCAEIARNLSIEQAIVSDLSGAINNFNLDSQVQGLYSNLQMILEDCSHLPEGFDSECRVEAEDDYNSEVAALQNELDDLQLALELHQDNVVSLQTDWLTNMCI